jgi:hypothetical protein
MIVGVLVPALVLAGGACSGGGAATGGLNPVDAQAQREASTLAAGTGSLTGALAFSIGKVIMSTAITSGTCSGTDVPTPGVIPAVAIFFAETGFAAQNICYPTAGLPTAGTNTVLDLEVATAQWATYPGTLTDPLVPGTYTISDEQKRNEDLCKLRGGGTAYLQIYPWGNNSVANAVSGTVTIESIATASVTGRFDVLMSGPFGQTDAGVPTPLSGEFNVAACR